MTAIQRKLGRYELLRPLASGGMGEIYLARTRGAGGFEKLVIIKTILPHLAEQEEFVTKFLDEGRIVVQLTHGNIVPVFDMGEEDGEYFIAMEYVPGLDLRAILKRLSNRDDPLPVEMALYIAAEVCKGLGYAHRKVDDQGNPLGIVHRDVSPSNVLISREGEVKIIDFGIARAAGKVAKTMTGRIQGKCCYMSPEQARGKALDARSDIFSTGVLLYEMLTLTRPFQGRSDLESLELVRECEFDPPGVLRPAIPQEVDDIIARTMARDPDDRYPVIDDLFVDLQDQIYQLGHTVTSQRLVEALEDVFAAEATDEEGKDTVRRPANLDEALELELQRLGDGPKTPASQPSSPLGLAATAASEENQTRTLGPTPATGSDTAPEPGSNAASSGQYPARDSGEHRSMDATPGMRPAAMEAPDSGEISSSRVDADPSPDAIAPAVQRRHLAAVVVALVTIAAGVGTAQLLRSPADGTLELVTDPPGAQIHLDGDELAGQQTPHNLELAPGSYNIELTLEDHRPRQFRADIEAGETLRLDEEDLTFQPERESSRQFTISAEPDDATLIADGQVLGTPPQQITLGPDEVVNLSARAPACSAIYYALSFGHEQQDVHLALDCPDREEQQESAPDREEDEPELRAQRRAEAVPDGAASAGNQRQPVLIETDPTGAEIRVDEDIIGQSPLYAELQRRQQATIQARRDGFEAYKTTVHPDDLDDNRLRIALEKRPHGCLDFRAVYPAHNEIAINDEWLDGRHMALQNHPIPAGDNVITVRHPESDREESFDVEIEPGNDCTVLTVWEPD